MNENPVQLYIMIRDDLDSMNPGKAAAQACHGANQCVAYIKKHGTRKQKAMLAEWEKQTPDHFGTTLVFAGSRDNIDHQFNRTDIRLIYDADLQDVVKGWITDPTYPVRDGVETHAVNIVTGGFIFGRRQSVFMDMNLMP